MTGVRRIFTFEGITGWVGIGPGSGGCFGCAERMCLNISISVSSVGAGAPAFNTSATQPAGSRNTHGTRNLATILQGTRIRSDDKNGAIIRCDDRSEPVFHGKGYRPRLFFQAKGRKSGTKRKPDHFYYVLHPNPH